MEGIKRKNNEDIFKTLVSWDEGKKAFLCSLDKKIIEIAAATQPQKHKDVWTPEKLFLASLKNFLKEAFMNCAKRNNFEFLSYESDTEGVMEKVENKLMFTEIIIRPRIVIASSSQVEKAKEILRLAKDNCYVFSSIAAMIMVYPEIKVKP